MTEPMKEMLFIVFCIFCLVILLLLLAETATFNRERKRFEKMEKPK